MSARQNLVPDVTDYLIRHAGHDDHAAVARFLAAMDRYGLYTRHFSYGDAPNEALQIRLDHVDQHDRLAVLAIASSGEVVGHGEYVAENGVAEFALMVLPTTRDQGLGARLLQSLIVLAAANGQRLIEGTVMTSNVAMRRIVDRLGFQTRRGDEAATVRVSRQLNDIIDQSVRPFNALDGEVVGTIYRSELRRLPLVNLRPQHFAGTR